MRDEFRIFLPPEYYKQMQFYFGFVWKKSYWHDVDMFERHCEGDTT